MKTIISLFLLLTLASFLAPVKPTFYELRLYRLADDNDEKRMDQYLQSALLPALHRKGIAAVGVFKTLPSDTLHPHLLYVLIPHKSIEQFEKVNASLPDDPQYQKDGSDYINADYSDPTYLRMETILLKAFKLAPQLQTPSLTGPRKDRIYEMRSYEGATEKLYQKKVHMFNEGNEIALFKRLNFNAVFYAETLVGSHMPNLMYMTTFENKADRDKHWDTFVNDSEWKTLKEKPEYQHTVSKNDTLFLYPTEYSDY